MAVAPFRNRFAQAQCIHFSGGGQGDFFWLSIGHEQLLADTNIGYRNVKTITQTQHAFVPILYIQIVNVVEVDHIRFLYPKKLCAMVKIKTHDHL